MLKSYFVFTSDGRSFRNGEALGIFLERYSAQLWQMSLNIYELAHTYVFDRLNCWTRVALRLPYAFRFQAKVFCTAKPGSRFSLYIRSSHFSISCVDTDYSF